VLQHEADKCTMQIGYRADEKHRKIKFINNNSEYMKFPIACKLYGTKKQIHKTFHWRNASFPLIDDTVTQFDVIRYWKDKHLIFPPQSNCAGCFHKDEVSLHLQWKEAPEQMQWFSHQEKLNKGTLLDSGL